MNAKDQQALSVELTVDYTSLFGGEAQQVKRQDLMKQWAGFLPGFDATFHQLGNLQVSVKGDKAQATVDFTASQWLGSDGFWAVSGMYEFGLKRADSNWQITSVKLIREAEQGSRGILADAPKNAVHNLKARQVLKVKY